MLEHKITCGYAHAPVLQSVKGGTSTLPSPCDGIFPGEGGGRGRVNFDAV